MTLLVAAESATGLTTGFWGAVGLAAAIATALATAASTAVSIWWRYQDRTEAEWSVRVEDRGGRDSDGRRVGVPKVGVVLQNIGDGAAHQVRVAGTHLAGEPWMAEGQTTFSHDTGHFRQPVHQPVPVLRTGDAIYVRAEAENFDVWDQATIEITWWPPPTRKKKDWFFVSRQQRQQFTLGDVTPPPNDLPPPKEDDTRYT
ncbi:hypothetical protein [Mycolicibacterium vaccae]|uniref:hypothetical protein n=1 Tax=Mycolicibacterium vaccae TaxID=1810 RepID=UPI003D007DED